MGHPILAHSCAALWDHSNKTNGTHPRCRRALLQPGSKMRSNQFLRRYFVDSLKKSSVHADQIYLVEKKT